MSMYELIIGLLSTPLLRLISTRYYYLYNDFLFEDGTEVVRVGLTIVPGGLLCTQAGHLQVRNSS